MLHLHFERLIAWSDNVDASVHAVHHHQLQKWAQCASTVQTETYLVGAWKQLQWYKDYGQHLEDSLLVSVGPLKVYKALWLVKSCCVSLGAGSIVQG